MNKILKSTLHRPCSCPEGKQCSRCIKTKALKPAKFRSRSPKEMKSKRQNKICQWYTRRKALKELKSFHNKERQEQQKRRLELERKKREQEVLEYLNRPKSEVVPSLKIDEHDYVKRQFSSAPPYTKPRPQVYMEEPRQLPVSLVVKRYRENPTIVQLFDRQSRWRSHHKPSDNEPVKSQNLHQWYKGRRSSENQRKFNNTHINRKHKIKEKNRKAQANSGKEFKVYDLMRQRSDSLPPPKVHKKVHVKRRSASVKPKSTSRYVAVKTYNHHESVGQRFANCFYRMCCRCYCYLTCIFLVVFFVICIL